MEYLTDNPLLSRLINSVKEFVIEQSSECDKYIGTLKNGKKSGYGKLIYKTGDIFEQGRLRPRSSVAVVSAGCEISKNRERKREKEIP